MDFWQLYQKRFFTGYVDPTCNTTSLKSVNVGLMSQLFIHDLHVMSFLNRLDEDAV